jgi:hypothetical protein
MSLLSFNLRRRKLTSGSSDICLLMYSYVRVDSLNINLLITLKSLSTWYRINFTGHNHFLHDGSCVKRMKMEIKSQQEIKQQSHLLQNKYKYKLFQEISLESSLSLPTY